MDETRQPLIDLAEPRTIAIRDRGHIYRYFFDRFLPFDYAPYFSMLDSAEPSELQRAWEITPVVMRACAELAQSNVRRVEGYVGQALTRDNWRDVLPGSHLRTVGALLSDANEDESVETEPLDPEHPEVVLKSHWSESGNDGMTMYFGLRHRFSTVEQAHDEQVQSALREVRVISIDRKASSPNISARARKEIEIYDQLIDSVEGYCVEGEPLTDRRDVIAHMDAIHKVVAVSLLLGNTNGPAPFEPEVC